jgi:preprotein translocase subunit SecE
MDDDIETAQSSQQSDSDVDIGTKVSTYTSATLKEMSTVRWPNIEKQLA